MEFRHPGTEFSSGNFDLKCGNKVRKWKFPSIFRWKFIYFLLKNFFFDLKYGRKSRKTRKIKKPFSMNPILKYGIFVKFNDFIKIF